MNKASSLQKDGPPKIYNSGLRLFGKALLLVALTAVITNLLDRRVLISKNRFYPICPNPPACSNQSFQETNRKTDAPATPMQLRELPPATTRNTDKDCIWVDCPVGQFRDTKGNCSRMVPSCPENMTSNGKGGCAWLPCPKGLYRTEQGLCLQPLPAPCPIGMLRKEEACVWLPCTKEGQYRNAKGVCVRLPDSFCTRGTLMRPNGKCECPTGQHMGRMDKCEILVLP